MTQETKDFWSLYLSVIERVTLFEDKGVKRKAGIIYNDPQQFVHFPLFSCVRRGM